VHADGALRLTATTEQAAQGKVQLNRLRINLDGIDKSLDSAIGLLVEQEIQP
jgi:hypothetical protein